MGKLFLHMAVFAAFTVLVYFVCMWFVKIEEERNRKRTNSPPRR